MKKQNNDKNIINIETFALSNSQEIVIQGKKDMQAYGYPFFLAYIPIDQLLTDMKYQRPTSEARVNKIVREFDPEKVDAKCVNYRPQEDVFACVDGLHTATALKAKGYKYIPCKVFIGKTYEEEALFFSAQNKGCKKITTVEEFNALLEAQDEGAKDIAFALDLHDIELAKISGVKKIRSIRKLTTIYEAYGWKGLDFCFTLLEDAGWEYDPKAYTEAGLNIGFYAYPECLKANGDIALTKYKMLLKVLRRYKTSTQYTNLAAHMFSETVTRHPQDAVRKLIQQDLRVINERIQKYQDTQKAKRSEFIERVE